MKSLAGINFYVALLIAILSNGVQGDLNITKTLDNMANKGLSIDNIFKPTKKGFLGKGVFSVGYKGIFLLKGIEVAMKFTSIQGYADREYKMYTYLNAINNPEVENYGVPTIYYYGTWNDHKMMAMTLLDFSIDYKFITKKLTKIDLLIMLREFVRITKYIHSCGVFQRDIKLSHMMYRKHQGFLFDFNVAYDGTNCNREEKLQHAQNDWKKFFSEMFFCVARHWDWLGFKKDNRDDVERMEYHGFNHYLQEDSKTLDKFDGLRRVFAEFVKYINGGDEMFEIQFYDLMYETIVGEIEKWENEQKQPAIPSWLSKNDKNAAILAKNAIPPISSIRDPLGLEEVESKDVDCEFFINFYRDKPMPEQPSKKSSFKFCIERKI